MTAGLFVAAAHIILKLCGVDRREPDADCRDALGQ